MMQHITYNEWLPVVLGPRVIKIFELTLNPRRPYDGYNSSVNPSVANAFAAAAFRFGHSLIKGSLARCNKQFREVPFHIELHKELNNPANMHNFGSVDRITLGLCSNTLARRDEYITEELTNHLFQVARSTFGNSRTCRTFRVRWRSPGRQFKLMARGLGLPPSSSSPWMLPIFRPWSATVSNKIGVIPIIWRTDGRIRTILARRENRRSS